MTEAISPTPTPPNTEHNDGPIRQISGAIARALGEIAVFTFAGPFVVATVQATVTLVVMLVRWAVLGDALESSPGGEPVWFGLAAIYWASYLILPPPFFCAGVVYAVLSRVLGAWLAVALISGLIGFAGFWFLAGWSLPTTDGTYFSPFNAAFAAAIAAGILACWWLLRPRTLKVPEARAI